MIKLIILLYMNTLLKIAKWYWIAVFIAAAALEILQGFQRDSLARWVYQSHIPLMLFIILIIFHRNWLSWLFMVFICIYGLYDLFIYAPKASSPTVMDFGFRLSYAFNTSAIRSPARFLLNPTFFYFFTLIFYFTKPVRKKYFNSESFKISSLK